MATSTERGIAFRARRRAEREALIAAGLLEPPRKPKRRPVANLNGQRFADIAPRERTDKTRRMAAPQPVDVPTRPGGPGAWPRPILYAFVGDSGLLHTLTESEVTAWLAARDALRRPWSADLAEADIEGLQDPGEEWIAPVRVGPGARALARLRSGACRFPHGEPSEPGFAYCGDPVHSPGASYCAEHAARCYGKGKP